MSPRPRRLPPLTAFDLEPGAVLAGKYRVVEKLGRGWEGEVYLVTELGTRIERSAKLFFPHRNPGGRAVRTYARKLHKLRHCPILIHYYTRESILFDGRTVTLLVSEFVEGERLCDFLAAQPGRRLDPFQALHLLHGLAAGIEPIHDLGEYHGDLHDENVLVRRRGLGFELKVLDMYPRGRATRQMQRSDLRDLIRLFYDAMGGRRRYAALPDEMKWICGGLKHSLIDARFPTVGRLRRHLETMEWSPD